MKGGRLIREARRRAGLSQARLAERLGTKQPVVARWETGERSPTLETVTKAVRACGFDLDPQLSERDPGEEASLHLWQQLSPKQRLERNAAMLETEEWAKRARRVPRREARVER
ncbi:MAG: helix-turn-helix domain-containing protein [Actinomycetota bacterium]